MVMITKFSYLHQVSLWGINLSACHKEVCDTTAVTQTRELMRGDSNYTRWKLFAHNLYYRS